jgi:hypothetical protein
MILLFGIIFLLAGGFGLYWTGKRAFHRRNAAGVQEFGSYGGALATRGMEAVIKIGSWLALIFGFLMVIAKLFSSN